MIKQLGIQVGVIGAALVAMTTIGNAQGLDIGKREYENNCAMCHGVSAKGDGPLAGMIGESIPDLTLIEKSNDGVFPFNQIYNLIDGTQTSGAHGTRDMPAWGLEYSAEAPQWCGEFGNTADMQSFVRGRILALIGYIHSLQVN